jgi:uncharacterized integral membrane protein (TIGR00698 family)
VTIEEATVLGAVPATAPAQRPQRIRQTALGLWPGLLLTAAAVVVAFAVHRVVPGIGVLTAAVALGVLLPNVGLHPAATVPGTQLAARRILRVGVVLLGLRLAVTDVLSLGAPVLCFVVAVVLVTFFGTQWLGRRLGVPPGTSLMVATGFSICGAAAIAAMDGVSDSDEEDVVTGIALVTICGTLAIAVLPTIGLLLGLSPRAYGIWAGASVHEVAQVVAAASPVAGALAVAVVVKLTRVVLLAPMVAGVSLWRRRAAGDDGSGRRPQLVPLFVLGFLLMVAVRTTGLVPEQALVIAQQAETVALAAALFGLGTGVHLGRLRRTGGRALLLGFSSWALVAVVSLAGVAVIA